MHTKKNVTVGAGVLKIEKNACVGDLRCSEPWIRALTVMKGVTGTAGR